MPEYEHYGESLNTHTNYFLMNRAYEEKLLIEELESNDHFVNFVIPVLENPHNCTGEQQVKENEKNVLRCTVGSL